LGQHGRNFVPHPVGLRVTVQQQEWRAIAALPEADLRLAGINRGELKIGKGAHVNLSFNVPALSSFIVFVLQNISRLTIQGFANRFQG
jgi:hypothetical protein